MAGRESQEAPLARREKASEIKRREKNYTFIVHHCLPKRKQIAKTENAEDAKDRISNKFKRAGETVSIIVSTRNLLTKHNSIHSHFFISFSALMIPSPSPLFRITSPSTCESAWTHLTRSFFLLLLLLYVIPFICFHCAGAYTHVRSLFD